MPKPRKTTTTTRKKLAHDAALAMPVSPDPVDHMATCPKCFALVRFEPIVEGKVMEPEMVAAHASPMTAEEVEALRLQYVAYHRRRAADYPGKGDFEMRNLAFPRLLRAMMQVAERGLECGVRTPGCLCFDELFNRSEQCPWHSQRLDTTFKIDETYYQE